MAQHERGEGKINIRRAGRLGHLPLIKRKLAEEKIKRTKENHEKM